MDRFEYDVSSHPADQFKRLVFFCDEQGCRRDEVPVDDPVVLADLLAERGQQGWELVQIMYRGSKLVAIWKRRIRG